LRQRISNGYAIFQPLSGAGALHPARSIGPTHMPHPSTNHLISRVRDFCRWHEKMFGDPSSRGVPVEDPIGWATDKEFWIRNTVWRGTIFEGNSDDAMAAADALIDRSLLRVKLTSEGRERTTNVRVREQTFRVFAVSKSILAWRGPSPARPDEILAARHAATMQHAVMQHALMNGDGELRSKRLILAKNWSRPSTWL
jgi:hypothetical protein